MSESLHFERGRRFLTVRELLNNHAALVGQPGFRPAKRWYQFWRWRKPDEPLVARVPNGPTITWARLPMPLATANGHFVIIGATGSGKSLLLHLLIRDIIGHLKLGPDQRLLIYDAKGNMLPLLAGMGVDPTLVDPFDERGSAWNLAADIRTPADAQQLAEVLIPSGNDEKENFWVNTTRNVVGAVVDSLACFRKGRWTPADVLLIMRSPDRIEALLSQRPETEHIWRNSQGDSKTRANVLASFASFLQRYEPVAALWSRTKKKFSLDEWVSKNGGILLVRNHPQYRASLAPIHRLLFDLAAKRTLSLPDSRDRHTWFAIDESRSMGKLEQLYHLTNEGRSKGIHVVLGTQSIEGIHHVYGKEHGEEILGQCRNKTFLRCDSQLTAEWIERQIGQVQFVVRQRSHSSGWSDGKRSSNVTESVTRRRESLVMASEILKLPPPAPGGEFGMINMVPDIGLYSSSYGFEELIGMMPVAKPGVPEFVERPLSHQRLLEWTAKDLKRLNLAAADTAKGQADDAVQDLFQKFQKLDEPDDDAPSSQRG